jgi:DNA polymerase bacteriophage-type
VIIHLDIEAAGTLDLREVGADVWTKHKDTVPILVGYAIDNQPPKSFVFPNNGWADLNLIRAVDAGAEIHAWNAPFEWAMWNNKLGAICPLFSKLPIERFHCTMATAACVGLPMDLGEAAVAAGTGHLKDKGGQALMLRMARPRSIGPAGTRWWHIDDPKKLELLRQYNIADVEAERAISQVIPRMQAREREIWLVDQKMNQRGLPVDGRLMNALSDITVQELDRLNRVIEQLTQGAITSTTQNARLLAWLQGCGYGEESLAKDTLASFIGSEGYHRMDADAQEVLNVRAEAAKTSTAKLKSIAAHSQHDGRARNLVQYAGAIRTLRWAGRGTQIQNFPRPSIKYVRQAIDEILMGMSAEGLRHLFGRPLDVVSSCLRGVFQAPPGFKLVVCDYHAIEAIVLAWLAEFEELLDVFRRGEDVYTFTARQVGSTDRQLGKVLRLACGYGMGPAKFKETAATYKLDLSNAQAATAVNDFRQANAPIVTAWHKYNWSAKQAILNPGVRYPVGRVAFRMADPAKKAKGALLLEKPSGGYLVYRDAHIHDDSVCYWGVDQYTHKWSQIRSYGGKLVENATQAIARDLLAEVMLRLENFIPGALITTVHDEIVAMPADQDADMLLGFLKSWMSTPPAWAAGMPLSAAGYVSDRYAKA